MSELVSRLTRIRDRIAELEAVAREDRAESAHDLAADLTRELNQAIEATAGLQSEERATPAREPRAPRDPVEKCPRCTLRSFTFQEGTMRERPDDPGHFEAQSRCMSCGHKAWQRLPHNRY